MRISVVMPLYNKAASVGAAIESVLSQTRGDFELFVVDDGSTDGSAAAARAFVDPRLRLIEQKNSGVSAARNAGVAAASGDWIAFLDADDRWEPRFLELLSRAAEEEPRAVAAFSNMRVEENGRSRLVLESAKGSILIEDYAAWFTSHRGNGLHPSSSLVKKSALLASGSFPEGVRSGEDTDTWFRLGWEGPVVYEGECLAVYDGCSTSSLSRASGAVYPAACDTIDRRLSSGRLRGKAARSARRARSFLLQQYAVSLGLSGRRREAARALLSAPPRPGTLRMWAHGLFALIFRR
jgi:glycosyltransferase involved in cell wall biosynthesis